MPYSPSHSEVGDDHEDVLLEVGDLDAVAEYLDVVLVLAGQIEKVRAIGAAGAAVRPDSVQRGVAHVEGVGARQVEGVPGQAGLAGQPHWEPAFARR